MQTKAGDPGAFAHFDLSRVPTPAFVIDEVRLRANLEILADVKHQSGAKILCALKAFSMWEFAPLIDEYLDGVCASGLWEARLAFDKYDGEVATYSPAFKASELAEIAAMSDHIIFNTPGQIALHSAAIRGLRDGGEQFDIGLRINPLHAEGEVAKYDPCQPHSRLGFPVNQLTDAHFEAVDGIHFHTLCEQDFEPLYRTWEAITPLIENHLDGLKWFNFGGGHHITRADYQREELIEFLDFAADATGCEIILEPGEAVALDAGILVGEILDVFENDMPVGITDISATCHMPDVIEAPYRPAMLGELREGQQIRLGGPSCLAGDIIGDYVLPEPPQVGGRIAFLDQAHYSMVKTSTFNGVPLPSIWIWNSETDDLRCVKEFDWSTFRDRLS
ncbi:carboxynorspermidine decarboxylase [Parasphingorhabdus marina DSM 22363]|uniref:Carboxynorspermidine/carboxyspermidine decarboxylase n=1 Tax=Parasphingorhabdus marina DSM 22363 TaxID=1123272 RepID=A0A1N6FM12_9SPHN|nr:carboxynorspermidine decarboxylase [Parasphingorhabdus marina]SIN96264.1 carboxynorspermidine decarboxylase [Parasphingorhabdus marina DSM 22363]